MQYSVKPLQCCCGDIWEFVDNSVAEKKKTLAIGERFMPPASLLSSGSSDFPFGLVFEKVKPSILQYVYCN